jgi:hypothetical protein
MILDYLSNEWQTKATLLQKMRNDDIILNERTLRLKIEQVNNAYINHDSDTFIVHSSKGYKIACSDEDIIESMKENHKRAMNLLRKERKVKRALLENGNLSFGW